MVSIHLTFTSQKGLACFSRILALLSSNLRAKLRSISSFDVERVEWRGPNLPPPKAAKKNTATPWSRPDDGCRCDSHWRFELPSGSLTKYASLQVVYTWEWSVAQLYCNPVTTCCCVEKHLLQTEKGGFVPCVLGGFVDILHAKLCSLYHP